MSFLKMIKNGFRESDYYQLVLQQKILLPKRLLTQDLVDIVHINL